MKGTIKFLDAKTKKWGFIVPDTDTNEDDVHFQVIDFTERSPTSNDEGEPVEFDVEIDGTSRKTTNVRFLGPGQAGKQQADPIEPGEALKNWAFVPFIPFTHHEGTEYSSILELLAQMALKERWHFGDKPNLKNPYPVLDNYLTYTFFKLKTDGGIFEQKTDRGSWATFNTPRISL